MKANRIEHKTKIIIFMILSLVIVLTLIIAVIASSDKKPDAHIIGDSAFDRPSGSLTYQPVTSITGPVNESETLSESPFIGSFENSYIAQNSSEAKAIFGSEIEGEPPFLVIGEDGDFTMTINAHEAGMLAVRGSVTVNGDIATFSIEARPSVDFLGSEVDVFSMRLIDKDDMRYSGEQIGTITKGDVFTRVTGEG